MGLKRSGKRLLKLGQKAARELGEDGKAWVDKVFQTAYGVIDEALGPKTKGAARERPAAAERSGRVKAIAQPKAKSKTTSTKAKGRRSKPQAPARKLGKAAARPTAKSKATSTMAKRPRAKPQAAARKPGTTSQKRPPRRRVLASSVAQGGRHPATVLPAEPLAPELPDTLEASEAPRMP